MPVYKKKCCVEGCEDKTSSRHRFPVKNEVLLSIWLDRIANNTIKGYDEKSLYNTCFVCSTHFVKECVNGIRLVRNSLPTINLPGFNGEPSLANSFWVAMDPNIDTTHTSPGLPHIMPCEDPTDDLGQHQELHFYKANTNKTVSLEDEMPSTSEGGQETHKTPSLPIQKPSTSGAIRKFKTRKRYNLLKKVDVTRSSELNSRERILYKVTSDYIHKSYRISEKLVAIQKRLRMANKLSKTKMFENISNNVSSTIYKFLLSQVKGYKLKARGRRFSLDDKILALSIFKNSPRSYRLLKIVLPSRRTLGQLLKKIPFVPGICERIFKYLKTAVSKLSDKNKYCTIIFDEVSLQAGLHYSKHRDVIEGFQCFGSTSHPRIADHALVFLAQGVYSTWKQPLAFMFCQVGTNSTQLAVLIKKIVRAVQSTGLIPIATVCDQASQNQAAITLLLKETENLYRHRNETNRNFGFEVDGKEIVPLLPHT